MRSLARLLLVAALIAPQAAFALDPGKVPPITLGTGSSGDASITRLTPPGGTARTLADRAGDAPSLKDFGSASGSDWTATVNTAQSASPKRLAVPEGAYSVGFDQFGAANKVYAGPGQFLLSNGFRDAPWRTLVTALKAAPTGWSPSPTDQWTGDFSQFYTAARSFITSSTTPPVANTYTNMPMNAMTRFGWETYAGFNAIPGNQASGRTGQWMHEDNLRHSGQGDATVWSVNIAANSALPGATHWLANPAVAAYNGNIYATSQATGAYLQGSELIYSDGGVSVAAVDRVRNYNRTNGNTSLGQVWIHDFPNSYGTVPIDAFYMPQGAAKRGLDFGAADFSSGNNAAIVLAQSQRIYFGGFATPDAQGFRPPSQSLGFSSLYQDAAGNLNVTLGTGASLKTQSVTLTGSTVATLPACSATTKGLMAMATDVSAAPTYRQTGLTGGGSIAVPVFCNGSAYEAH